MSGTEPSEFARIHEAYRDKVLAYAAQLIGADDAEDVTQEVFIKVDRSLHTLSEPSKLASWIFAIALNTVRDVARRRATRAEGRSPAPDPAREGEEEDTALSRVPDRVTPTPEEDVMRHEMVACYLDFVNRLPRNYYEVYALSEFEHLAIEEIARHLSLSTGAVKIRLHRARSRLYQELRCHCRPYVNERGELMGEPKDR